MLNNKKKNSKQTKERERKNRIIQWKISFVLNKFYVAVYTRFPAIQNPNTIDVSRFHPFTKWKTDKQQQKQDLPSE